MDKQVQLILVRLLGAALVLGALVLSATVLKDNALAAATIAGIISQINGMLGYKSPLQKTEVVTTLAPPATNLNTAEKG